MLGAKDWVPVAMFPGVPHAKLGPDVRELPARAESPRETGPKHLLPCTGQIKPIVMQSTTNKHTQVGKIWKELLGEFAPGLNWSSLVTDFVGRQAGL